MFHVYDRETDEWIGEYPGDKPEDALDAWAREQGWEGLADVARSSPNFDVSMFRVVGD